jgi:hypothetical protein
MINDKRLCTFFPLALLLGMFCTSYNPFKDPRNAQLYLLHSTFRLQDSIPIFTTQSLTVGIGLHEQVDSLRISIEKNRFWTKDSFGMRGAPVPGALLLTFSFIDTGIQFINLESYPHGGEKVVKTIPVHTYSPLHQNSIDACVNDTILLKTPGVSDNPVHYVWDFGDDVKIIYPESMKVWVFERSYGNPQCSLYITDI